MIRRGLSKLDSLVDLLAADIAAVFGRLRRPTRMLLVQEDGAFTLFRRRRNGVEKLAEGPLAQMAARLRASPRKPRFVEVRLDKQATLERSIELPRQSKAHLATLVPLQIERLTPWAAGHARYAYAVRPTTDVAAPLTVDIVALAAPAFAGLTARLEAAGLKAVAIGTAREPLGKPPAIDLLKQDAAEGKAPRGVRAFVLTWAVLAAAAVAGSGLMRAETESVVAERAARLEAVTAQLAELAPPDVAQPEREGRTVPAVIVLEVLSETLDDDTYLTGFGLAGAEMRLAGFSQDANSLIEQLEDTAVFTGAHLTSSVTLDRALAAERFEIAAKIVEEAR